MNIIIGGFLGIILSVSVILIVYILNDSIKSVEDIEKYLGMNTLGVIPIAEETNKKTKNVKKRKIKAA
jgi:capsular polysaccharide biosynthesis protein